MTRALPLILLICMGALWGLSLPLSKIAVASGHRDIGIIFWQFTAGAVFLAVLNAARGKGLPVHRSALLFYTMIALVGTLLPNWASFASAVHLPAGILAIIIATVPMFAFPMALALRMDRFSVLRFIGLLLGLISIILIALPDSSLPDPSVAIWLLVAVIAPFFYASEANIVAKWGTWGLDPVQVLLGASIIGAILSAPLAIGTGEWINPLEPWNAGHWAILGIAVSHTTAYVCYVWLVGQAGAVFTSQVGYLVTGFGILWAQLILGESYSPWVWGALALMLLGVFLVQPRGKA